MDNPVQKLFYGRAEVPFASSFLLFEKKGKVQRLLHALKYRSKPAVGELLGKWYGQELVKNHLVPPFDVIIPVPLHKKRLQKRGYNQSEYIARGLAQELGLPVLKDVLVKKQFTETQTFKSREERWLNTQHSFGIAEGALIAGKRVLLVDDVITTGATTEACIKHLQVATGLPVSVVSLAYTL